MFYNFVLCLKLVFLFSIFHLLSHLSVSCLGPNSHPKPVYVFKLPHFPVTLSSSSIQSYYMDLIQQLGKNIQSIQNENSALLARYSDFVFVLNSDRTFFKWLHWSSFLQVLLLAWFDPHIVFTAAGRIKWFPESLQDRHSHISHTFGHVARGLTAARREAAGSHKTWAEEPRLQGPYEPDPDSITKGWVDLLHQTLTDVFFPFFIR